MDPSLRPGDRRQLRPSERGFRADDRMRSGESTDRYPPARLLPTRPGSPDDSDPYRRPGFPDEASRSASQRRALGRQTGAGMTQRECEQIYDSGTGMTRQEWSASCRRVGSERGR